MAGRAFSRSATGGTHELDRAVAPVSEAWPLAQAEHQRQATRSGLKYAVHFLSPGPGALPLALGLLEHWASNSKRILRAPVAGLAQ
jgi:hypothetical protein